MSMADISNPKLLYAKAVLLLVTGLLASTLLLLEHPTLQVGFLLAVSIWCFARCYYFVFYVIEHYIDPGYRFGGLWSFACYLLRRKKGAEQKLPAKSDSEQSAGG